MIRLRWDIAVQLFVVELLYARICLQIMAVCCS